MPADSLPRGYTPRELAKVLRVSPDRVRGWIKAGQLEAIDTSTACLGRPRFVILPHHVAEFERRRKTGPPRKRPIRRRSPKTNFVDFYPD